VEDPVRIEPREDWSPMTNIERSKAGTTRKFGKTAPPEAVGPALNPRGIEKKRATHQPPFPAQGKRKNPGRVGWGGGWGGGVG